MNRESIFKVKNLNKKFTAGEIETHALSDINLDVKKGDFISLRGPSGCGKSTLLSILGLVESDYTGMYELGDIDVGTLGQKQKAKLRNQEIGFIFQSFNLINDITIAENIGLPLTFRTSLSKKAKEQMVNEAMDKLQISHRANHFPYQLSGGQQQRAAVARAVVGSPSLLLADEPTGNLDSKHGEDVMQILGDLHQSGSTIFMVTHDSRYSNRSSRVIDILDGEIINTKGAPCE